MKNIKLPKGLEFVPFEDLPHYIAEAIWRDGDDDEGIGYGAARLGLESELPRAVRDGALKVRNPITLGPHTFPVGRALDKSIVSVDDLRAYVADRGLRVEVDGSATPSLAKTDTVASVLPMKQSALVERVMGCWPTIEKDLKDASRNGLKEVAHFGNGWSLERAKSWAEAKGKLKKGAEKSSPATPWDGLSR